MTGRNNEEIWSAAEKANQEFGQWMPQRWIECFIAALPAPVEAPVAVKPLVWREGPPGTHTYVAESVFGQYSAWFIESHGVWCGPNDRSGNLHGSSLDAAKAAAQADYEQRIRSALIATQRPLPSLPSQTQEYTLRAMAKNYANGNLWDDLDREAVTKAADEIKALRSLLGGSAHG